LEREDSEAGNQEGLGLLPSDNKGAVGEAEEAALALGQVLRAGRITITRQITDSLRSAVISTTKF
jgi:hypothetical protein